MNMKIRMAFFGTLCYAVAIPSWAQEECYDAFLSEDWNAAYRLCLPLAERGDVEAQYNLGAMYDAGQGVAKDASQAAYWWRKAAEQGDAQAQYNLGMMYLLGMGAPKDYAAAYKWIGLAVAHGDDGAQGVLDLLRQSMSRDDVTKAEEQIEQWLQIHQDADEQ